jgi:HSP20 family protein
MSNITIQKHNGDKPAASAPADLTWDPWHTMRALLAWNPFREMAPLPVFGHRELEMSPDFDVKETKDAYLFKADVPGIREHDLEVTMTGDRLTVSGKRDEEKEEKADRYYTYERHHGSFTRTFRLPEGADVDELRASLEHGVLTVTVPKRPEVQPRKVAVTTTEGAPSK